MLSVHCVSVSLLTNQDNTTCLLEVAHIHKKPQTRTQTMGRALSGQCHCLTWDLGSVPASQESLSSSAIQVTLHCRAKEREKQKISTGRNQSNDWELLITFWAAEAPGGPQPVKLQHKKTCRALALFPAAALQESNPRSRCTPELVVDGKLSLLLTNTREGQLGYVPSPTGSLHENSEPCSLS